MLSVCRGYRLQEQKNLYENQITDTDKFDSLLGWSTGDNNEKRAIYYEKISLNTKITGNKTYFYLVLAFLLFKPKAEFCTGKS